MPDHDTVPHVHGPNCDHDHDHHHHVKPEPIRKVAAPGRNEPCWCGSGRKYKACHWKADRAS